MIFVNFKNYPQSRGVKAVILARICEKVSIKTGIPIIPCVNALDLVQVIKNVDIPVWTQHIDPYTDGKTTGFITAKAVKDAGARGTLINHSEHELTNDFVEKCINFAKEVGLQTMVLAQDLDKAKTFDKFLPDYIGIEEPSLIGGKVAMAEVESERTKIKNFVSIIKKSTPIVGAGINKKKDIQVSLSLGAKGVLVATAVVLSENQNNILEELASCF